MGCKSKHGRPTGHFERLACLVNDTYIKLHVIKLPGTSTMACRHNYAGILQYGTTKSSIASPVLFSKLTDLLPHLASLKAFDTRNIACTFIACPSTCAGRNKSLHEFVDLGSHITHKLPLG